MNYIIGCGGGGSILAPIMTRLVGQQNVILVDGDTLEPKNLDRQMFTEDEIGTNKAIALASRLQCRFLDRWYSQFEVEHSRHDWLFCCVDNNPGRKEVLAACDLYGCSAIVAANEVHSSEAYVYRAEWKDLPHLDPRIYYPEIITDATGNPAAARIGCTGEAQANNRQLVTANFMAVALAAHLYVVWAMESKKVKLETQPYLPHRLSQNLTRNGFVLRGELEKQTN